MSYTATIDTIYRGLISFEDYKPLKIKNGRYLGLHDVGSVHIGEQSSNRFYIQFDNTSFTKTAVCYFSDYNLLADSVKKAITETFSLIPLTIAEYDAFHDSHINKYRKLYKVISFKDAMDLRCQHNTSMFGEYVPSKTVDIRKAIDPKWEYGVDAKKFKSIMLSMGISLDTDEQYQFLINDNEFTVSGTPGYVLSDRCGRKVLKPNCMEWKLMCNAFKLKTVSCGYVNATHLMDKGNAMSLYSFSVNGGTCTNAFAINLATDHIVPLDEGLDICNHKKGWYYTYLYMGRHAFYPALEIVTGNEDEFIMGQTYDIDSTTDADWASKAVVKIARLLVGFGVPDESIIKMKIGDTKTNREKSVGIFHVFTAAESEPDKVLSLMRKTKEGNSLCSLGKDPLVQEIRKHYALIINAPQRSESAVARKLLYLIRDFAKSLYIRGEKLNAAYDKAFWSQNLADVEIYKEIVHSAVRKSPLFRHVYGDANPADVFVLSQSMGEHDLSKTSHALSLL